MAEVLVYAPVPASHKREQRARKILDRGTWARQVIPAGKVIAFEGAISVGKTTLTRTFIDKVFGDQGAHLGQEKGFEKFLLRFLKDPAKWGGYFQMYMLTDVNARIEIASQISRDCAARGIDRRSVIERTQMGNRAFMELNKGAGNMDEVAVESYDLTSNECSQDRSKIDYLVYLDISPQKSMERIVSRNRPGEKDGYKIEYIEALDREMFRMIVAEAMKSDEESPLPIILIDWTNFGTPHDILVQVEKAKQRTRICPRITKLKLGTTIPTGAIVTSEHELYNNAQMRATIKSEFVHLRDVTLCITD